MNINDVVKVRAIKILEKLITTIGWIFMLGYVFQILASVMLWSFNLSNFYHKLFVLYNIKTTLRILITTIVIALCVFIVMYSWGRYNYKRYAHLKRRKFPQNVTNHEIALYFNLPISLVEKMKNDKVVVLEKTIV
ncbi:poly-beta-1,6-N-acetyl-D-glucosamine biosynthesis protein PgaD [Clostridium sp. WILCCON 0269]|uniref:Poly-beta-1,6-N-acetyl-D-glucosamine biosynthesis protein PgaD n=1 Tax=Candidatus Clostridium eludens TaxID=3381663 RepID=A0ABW8SJT9_9CLOT